jgi:hypothetical protein
MSFARQLQTSLGEWVYLVRGTHSASPAWHYVLVEKTKLPLFLKAAQASSLDVADYGEILYSGWGENPPPEIVADIKARYA